MRFIKINHLTALIYIYMKSSDAKASKSHLIRNQNFILFFGHTNISIKLHIFAQFGYLNNLEEHIHTKIFKIYSQKISP